jgi:hypothetical protein
VSNLRQKGAGLPAARGSLQPDWELVAPLPFGLNLNIAIKSHPADIEDARALLDGPPAISQVRDSDVRERAARLFDASAKARRFELGARGRTCLHALSRVPVGRILRAQRCCCWQ